MFGRTKKSFRTSEIFLFKDSDILCEIVYNVKFTFRKYRWTKELDISEDKFVESVRNLVYLDIASFFQKTKIGVLENDKSLFMKALKNALENGSKIGVYKSFDDNLSLEIEIEDVYKKQSHDRKLKLKQIFDELEK